MIELYNVPRTDFLFKMAYFLPLAFIFLTINKKRYACPVYLMVCFIIYQGAHQIAIPDLYASVCGVLGLLLGILFGVIFSIGKESNNTKLTAPLLTSSL
jgi:predicted branched-subunit amino acid permease